MTTKTEYDRYTIQFDERYDWWSVYGWGAYPHNSVLSGQPMKQFIGSFDTFELATEAFPQAKPSNKFLDPQVSLSHLPGPDDPVPGGMYPDDWD